MDTAQGKGFEVVGKDGEVQAKTIDGAEEVKVAQGKGVKSTLNGGRVAMHPPSSLSCRFWLRCRRVHNNLLQF